MKLKLTRAAVEKLPLPKEGYDLVWDTELPNFGLRITAGGTRSYFVQRRVNGKDRRITLGRSTVFPPEKARDEARKLLGDFARGKDPTIERTRQKALSVTVEEAFKAYQIARKNLKPSTVKDITRALADLGWNEKRLFDITPDMVEERHTELGKASHARANLTMRYLRALYNFAAEKYGDSDRPLLNANPVRRLSKTRAWYDVDRRRTYIKEHELKPWMQAVQKLGNAEARDYFLTVLLTGLRRTEAMDLPWDQVDLKARTLTIPDPKNRRPHVMPLTDYLLTMFETRKKAASGKFVFQSERGRLHNLRYALADVQEASKVAFCIHDLRRTFTTTAERLDIPGYALKRLLNHKNKGDVTEGYIGLDVERLRKPMQQVTDYLLAAGGVRQAAQVVPIKEAKRKPRAGKN